MEHTVRRIGKDTKLLINGEAYEIEAKARYVTEKDPDKWYVKVFLAGHHVLVMSPSDDFIYFGKDVGSIGISPPFEEQIVYNGKKYRLIGEDYQIMTNLEFGSPLTTEGEVQFWDYECSSNDKDIISIGIVKRSEGRGDVVASVISLDDIELEEEKD